MQSVSRNRRIAMTTAGIFAAIALVSASVLNAQPTPGTPAQPTPPKDAPGTRGGERGPGGGRGEGAPVSVERSMKGIGSSLSKLSKQVGDSSKKAENIALISRAQASCVAARSGTPKGEAANETDATKKLAMLVPYRKLLIELERTLIDIEVAILDDKTDDAKKLIEKCLTLKTDGHKAMGVKDDD